MLPKRMLNCGKYVQRRSQKCVEFRNDFSTGTEKHKINLLKATQENSLDYQENHYLNKIKCDELDSFIDFKQDVKEFEAAIEQLHSRIGIHMTTKNCYDLVGDDGDELVIENEVTERSRLILHYFCQYQEYQ